MKTRWMYWAVYFMWLAGAVGAAEAPDASGRAPVIARHGAVTQAVEARWRYDGESLWLTVTGLDYAEVTGITQQGRDLTGGLAAALNRAEASVERRAEGFTLRWNRPPDDLRLDENATLELATAQGTVVAAAAESIACPVLTSFGRATAPALAADPACGYNSVKCKNSGQRHAGIDYNGNGDALAIASGTVVRVEALNANDHGLGNNIIVRHVLPGPHCAIVYSSYSRLGQIGVAVGDTVAKGQKLGMLGRSGHGNPNFWPAAHLHLELKAAPVTGNPLGAGRQNQTCATDPLNAQADTCWAYVGRANLASPNPDELGYLNPTTYLNKTLRAPSYREVSAGGSHTCVVKPDNSLVCWGNNRNGQAIPPAGTFKSVTTSKEDQGGGAFTCALKADNNLTCWGFHNGSPPTGAFKSVSLGSAHACAVKADNTLACWGQNISGQATPPAGAFKAVSAGTYHNCALKLDNTLVCWGRNYSGQATPPAGVFKSVSPGSDHTCAVKADNTLACWGKNYDGQATPPAGSFKSVSAGSRHACAVKADNTLACWGDNDYGQASPPAGTFKSVSAGEVQTCGLKADDTPVCWGNNNYGQSTPPAGTYQSVSGSGVANGGSDFVCAIKVDNTLACWGENYQGQTTPPTGAFKSLSSGGSHTCAIKANNTLACWGETTMARLRPR